MADTIECKRCGNENPADARFCIDCGAELASAATGPTTRLAGVACRSCGASNPEHARFCVVCGRTMAGAPAPTPAPHPAAPRLSTRPAPRQSYPRVATPPQLVQLRPMPPARPARRQQPNAGALVFVIGLGLLLANGSIWPGIALLIPISIVVQQIAEGRTQKALTSLLWVAGIMLLLAVGMFGLGVFGVLFLVALLGGWGHPYRRRYW